MEQLEDFRLMDDLGQECFKIEDGVIWYKHPYYGDWWRIRRLLKDCLLVRMDRTPDVTKGGIIIPPKARRRPQQGIVLAKGAYYRDPDTGKKYPMDDFQVGDKILFKPLSGIPMYFNREIEVWFFRAASILGLITGDEDAYTPMAKETEDDLEYEEETGAFDDRYDDTNLPVDIGRERKSKAKS